MALDTAVTINLYDAALDPTKWSIALDGLCPMMGARSANILVIDSVSDKGPPPYSTLRLSSVFDPELAQKYVRDYSFHEQNHVMAVFSAKPGVIITDPDFTDRDTILKRPDVAFLHKHFGFIDRIGIRLNSDKEYGDCLAFQYAPERSISNTEEFTRLKPYLPHIAQAVASSRLYDAIRRRYSAVLAVLDRVNIGLLLVRPNGSIVFSNLTADEICNDSPSIKKSTGGYLQLSDPASQLLLTKSIEEVSSTASGIGNNSKRIVLAGSSSDNNKIMLEITPLRDSEIEIERGLFGALVMIIDPNRDTALNITGLTQLYSLTPTESVIAEMVSSGKSNKEISDERMVSPETVKSQLQSLYRKTQTSNRTGLLRRIISIAVPFKD